MKRPLYLARVESVDCPEPGFTRRVVHATVGATDEATLLHAIERVRWTERMSLVPANDATVDLFLRLSVRRTA